MRSLHRLVLRRFRRRLGRHIEPAFAVLLLGCMLSTLAFIELRGFELERTRSHFLKEADDRLRTLDVNIELTVGKLKSLGAFFDVSDGYSRDDFRRLAAPLTADDRAIQALEWVPRIEARERTAYEAELRRESPAASPGFIGERGSQGAMVVAASRPEYFPVHFVEPLNGNEKAREFDLASNPSRREALQRASRTGQMAATGRVVLVQETGDQFGVLIFRPVYLAPVPSEVGREPLGLLKGFVLGVFRIGDILASDQVTHVEPRGIEIALFDRSAPAGEHLLFPKARSADWDSESNLKAEFKLERSFAIGGRVWHAIAYAAPGAFAVDRLASGSALLTGFAISGLLAAMLRMGYRRRQEIEAIVAQRTAELERAQAELIRAKDAAVAGSRAKSNFLATVSHELRTPMNGVIGFAELLLLPGASDAEREEYARTILSSSKLLLSLLDDILDFSKIEAGKMQLSMATIEPERKLKDMVAIFGETARSKQLRLEAKWMGPPRARYVGDSIRIRQILANLINNALKFTDRGGVMVEAREVGAHGDEVELEFSVTDTGIGISADKIGILFKPFSQVEDFERGTSMGTGLGLSIVRKLAQIMKGDAWVESHPGRGSRFWVRIRVWRLASDPAAAPSGPRALQVS